MKLGLAALAMIMATPAAADPVADIKAARAAYNAAIAARDAAGVRAALGEGYVGIAGTGGEAIVGADAMTDYFARAFKSPCRRSARWNAVIGRVAALLAGSAANIWRCGCPRPRAGNCAAKHS